MKSGKIILFVLAAFFLLFSFFIFLGTWGRTGVAVPFWFGIGLAVVGFLLIFFATRMGPAGDGTQNVTVNIDLPGEVGMDTIKCTSCGGVLSEKDVKLVAGAPVVTCPWCGTTYQLTEEPKW
jgi:phage FluMu protein Com